MPLAQQVERSVVVAVETADRVYITRPTHLPPLDSGSPDAGSFDSLLESLRERTLQAREERGSCPTWDELRADLLPGGGQRPGREERQVHLALCHICQSYVDDWKRS